MPRAPINLINHRFHSLLVIERVPTDKPNRFTWLCRCDCGNETTCDSSTLKNGRKKSCGCKRSLEINKHQLYRVWGDMKQRCLNSNNANYKHYGGRGIKICDSWLKYPNFYRDVVEGYKRGLELDRINTNGNYEPCNTRWATSKQNSNNTRRNINISYKGKTQTLTEWAEEKGIVNTTLWSRIDNGWSIEDAIEKPVKKRRSKT